MEDSLPSRRLGHRLSTAIAVLMALQAGTGLLWPAIYRDSNWMTAAWFGNDIVTLCFAVPLLVWALFAERKGSRRAELVWYAMLGYAVYNYGFYLFGAAINLHFPVYVALFALPVFTLILLLGRLDPAEVAADFVPQTPINWVGGYMFFTGAGLALAWIAQWLNFMLTGATPDIGEEAFKLVAAMDLSFMVPWFIVGAAMLVKNTPWGYVIAPIIIAKGATYTLVLTVTSTVAATRGVSGALEQLPVWIAWTAAGAFALLALFRNLRT